MKALQRSKTIWYSYNPSKTANGENALNLGEDGALRSEGSVPQWNCYCASLTEYLYREDEIVVTCT